MTQSPFNLLCVRIRDFLDLLGQDYDCARWHYYGL